MRFLVLFVLTLCAAHAAPRAPRAPRALIPSSRDQYLRKLILEDPRILDDLAENIFDGDTEEDEQDDEEDESSEETGSYDFLAIFAVIEDPKTHKPIVIVQEVPLDMRNHVIGADSDAYDELRLPVTEASTTLKPSDPTDELEAKSDTKPEDKTTSEPDTKKPQPGGDVTPKPSPAQPPASPGKPQ